MNGSVIGKLLSFISSPSKVTASDLKLTPALFHVVDYELKNLGKINPMTMGTCKWLYKVSYVALRTMETYGYPLCHEAISESPDLWQKVRFR